MLENIISTIFFIFICLATGFLGSSATLPEISGWYQTILKPSWNPPAFIFAPVWTLLYGMMGLAAARIWQKRRQKSVFQPLALFMLQLFLNGAWSFIFFRFHLLGFALIEILMLWTAILLTLKAFREIDRTAAGLLVPYLLWVSFASCLNANIWWINR